MATPLPEPPTLLLIVDDFGCTDQVCPTVLQPWTASVTLPPLPTRLYRLITNLAKVTCRDTVGPGDTVAVAYLPFDVSSCGVYPGYCLLSGWEHPNGLGNCDARVSATEPAEVTMVLKAPVNLAGLQGSIRFSPPGLRITSVKAVGPAAGMHLTVRAIEGGVTFNMFAEHGAPIPGGDMATPPDPVLRVTFQATASETPRITYVDVGDLLGSDIEGREVPYCDIRTMDERFRIAYPGARICAEVACDFDDNGVADVRDLVRMVHCVHQEGACPDDAATRFDCNADQAFGLEDVLCCAAGLLAPRPCPSCPDPPSRPEPAVRLSLGEPITTPTGVDLPVRLDGEAYVGAARLVIECPLDRYDLAGVTLQNLQGQWLELHEARGSNAVIALVRVSNLVIMDPLDLMVHLRLKSGQSPGGTATVTEGEFSGPDGVALDVNLGRPTQPLSGPVHIALSESRPNPASSEAHFSLTLSEAADVEVGIYDLGGRLVATVFRGLLAGGTRDFAWDGRRSDGRLAVSGMYFYRASSAGSAVARRLVLLRGN